MKWNSKLKWNLIEWRHRRASSFEIPISEQYRYSSSIWDRRQLFHANSHFVLKLNDFYFELAASDWLSAIAHNDLSSSETIPSFVFDSHANFSHTHKHWQRTSSQRPHVIISTAVKPIYTQIMELKLKIWKFEKLKNSKQPLKFVIKLPVISTHSMRNAMIQYALCGASNA